MNDYVKSIRALIGSRPMLLPGVRALIFSSRREMFLLR